VLLQAAADHAAGGGQADLVQAALKTLADQWQGDWLARRLALLKTGGSAVRWQGRLDDFIGPCVEAVAETRKAGRYQAGMDMCDALVGWGRPLGDAVLLRMATDLRDELAAEARMRQSFDKAQEVLKSRPEDPNACSAAGRYLAFFTDRQEEGVGLMAKGDHAGLKALAGLDVAGGASAGAALDAAAAWANLAGKEAQPIRRRAMRRAGQCFDKAIGAMDAPARAAALKRFRPLHLAILTDRMNRLEEWEVVRGRWTTTPSGRLLGAGDSHLRFGHKLPGTVYVEFHLVVLEGMRPRVHFEETGMCLGNEGSRREFWPHGAKTGDGLWEPYANGQDKCMGVYLAGERFEWFADGRPTGHGTLSRSADQITLGIQGGDGWSKGSALYWGFRVLAAPPLPPPTSAPWPDAREARDVQEEVGP
jgi:hypothetical protein